MAEENLWRKLHIMIAPDIADWVMAWQGGEGSSAYVLGETASKHGVASLSMIDAALEEFEDEHDEEGAEDLNRLIKNLEEIRKYWPTNMRSGKYGITYALESSFDPNDYGHSPEEEAEVVAEAEEALEQHGDSAAADPIEGGVL